MVPEKTLMILSRNGYFKPLVGHSGETLEELTKIALSDGWDRNNVIHFGTYSSWMVDLCQQMNQIREGRNHVSSVGTFAS